MGPEPLGLPFVSAEPDDLRGSVTAGSRRGLLTLLTDAQQLLELASCQGSFKIGLVLPPGVTCLQDSPDGRPSLRAIPIQAHLPGDCVRSLQDVGRGPMACGKEADVGAWVSDAWDWINGHIACAVPQEVLVEEVSVEHNCPLGCGAQSHGGSPRRAQTPKACFTSRRSASGSLFVGRVIARLILQVTVGFFEGGERERRCPGSMKSGEQVGGDLDGDRIVTCGQVRRRPDSLQDQSTVLEVRIDEAHGGSGVLPHGQRSSLRPSLLLRDRQLHDDLCTGSSPAPEHVGAKPAIKSAAALEVPSVLTGAKPRCDVHSAHLPTAAVQAGSSGGPCFRQDGTRWPG
jgi:hypothetical protein